jgi:hypothetical protein
MTRSWTLCLFLLLFLSCAFVERPDHPAELVSWPSNISFLEGEGDLSFSSQRERFSGSFLLSLTYPSHFFLEVYGSFGQTLVHVERNKDIFLFVAGEEKTNDELALSKKFGLSAQQLMDDLTARGLIESASRGRVIPRQGYDVVFSKTKKGKQTACWERPESKICLVFDKIVFEEP